MEGLITRGTYRPTTKPSGGLLRAPARVSIDRYRRRHVGHVPRGKTLKNRPHQATVSEFTISNKKSNVNQGPFRRSLNQSNTEKPNPSAHANTFQPRFQAKNAAQTVSLANKIQQDQVTEVSRIANTQQAIAEPAATYSRKQKLLKRCYYAFGVVSFSVALFAGLQTIYSNHKVTQQREMLGATVRTDEQGVAEGSADEPSEEPVSEGAIRSYSVKPNLPRYIRIPSIKVNARVKAAGINSNGDIDAPWNIHDVNWYDGSVLPGSEQGTSLLVGHVSGWTQSGVFKELGAMKFGDTFQIEKGDGTVLHYTVNKVAQKKTDEIDISELLTTEEAGRQDIKLMTCAGKYNAKTKEYEDRVIIYAFLDK